MIPASIRIETARCWLRRFNRDDIPFVFSASRYSGFCDGMRWSPPVDESELVEPFRRNVAAWESGKAYAFTIESKEDRASIGRISIRRQERKTWDLGFWTHPESQGQGYMTEAAGALFEFGFRTVKAERIEAAHVPWNISSRRVIEKIGMTFVRHIPKGFQKEDQWVTEDLWSITLNEHMLYLGRK